MIIGIVSDSHADKANALPHIMREFEKRGVEFIIHCGDIEPKHLKTELFNDLPVVCALVEGQNEKPEFTVPPRGWRFTKPEARIIDFEDIRMYVGHKRSFEFLTGSEASLIQTLNQIRMTNDCVRWVFSGHTHHQIFKQGRIIHFLNPGAVENSFDGYEFAVIDTKNEGVIFSRIPKTVPVKEQFSIGVVSDSLNISELDKDFWGKLARELQKYDVHQLIHCGNLNLEDVGREELKAFQVHYNLRPDQKNPQTPENWHLISAEEPVVEINGYYFYIQLDLSATLLEKSEFDMHMLCLNLRRKYPNISFVLCGFTNDAFLEEGEQVRILNPGDVVKDHNFAVISLPTTEITFTHVPLDPLP